MIKPCTIYTIRKTVEEKLSLVSSNSMGSIQTAIRKLLLEGMVIFIEVLENGKMKKIYELTDKGKSTFYDKITKPMMYKEKNMELIKLFFMGFVDKNARVELIDSYIFELKIKKSELKKIHSSSGDAQTAVSGFLNYLQENKRLDSFKEVLKSESLSESLQDIAMFQYAMLELSIDKVDFEIQWFEQFRNKLVVCYENK